MYERSHDLNVISMEAEAKIGDISKQELMRSLTKENVYRAYQISLSLCETKLDGSILDLCFNVFAFTESFLSKFYAHTCWFVC